MFGEGIGKETPKRIANAKKAVTKMGYDLHVQSISVTNKNGNSKALVKIENRGVAPFYYDWPVNVAVISNDGSIRKELKTSFKLPSILPGSPQEYQVDLQTVLAQGERIAIRIPNPMDGGKPLRFANAETEIDGEFWVATPK